MKRASNTGRQPYRTLNRVFLAILIAVMAYSALFSPEKGNHPIPSGSRFFHAQPNPSTGLSRSFSAIVRFRFREAGEYNVNGIRIFLFFFIQMIMRVAGLELAGRLPERSMGALFYTDAVLSVLLLIYCFWPFLTAFYLNSLNI